MKSLMRALFGVGALAVAVLAQPAKADSIPIFPVTPDMSDAMVVWDGTGRVVANISCTEADEIANGPGHVYALQVAIDATQFGNYTTLMEGDAQGSVSDVFGVANIDGGLFLGFSSDVDGVPFPYGPNSIVIAENANGFYDATMYLDPANRAAGWHATFYSDPEVTTSVPTPAAFTGAAVLAGLIFVRRRMFA